MSCSMKNEVSLLDLIEARYKELDEKNLPRLTIPALFRRSYDENFISDYLAYILDPDRNGVGIQPLQALLSLAYEDALEIDLMPLTINREYTFGDPDFGRMDLLIRLGEDCERGVIGIENKIFSSESENQTIAYERGFKKDFKGSDHYLIFLTPDGHLPVSKEFKPVSYADLVRSLREIRYPVLDDIHKSVIWEDFLAHLEEYIVMNNGKLELSEKTRLYLEHHEILKGLADAYHQDAQRIYDYVIASIKNSFGEGWDYRFQGGNSFQEIDREAWKLGNFYLFYQFLFSRENLLIEDHFSYMLGAYPKNRESRQFIDWLRTNYPQIQEICAAREMQAYPPKAPEKASYLIAFKEFQVAKDDMAAIDRPFIKIMGEFSVFTPIMDEVVRAYTKSKLAEVD
jgi:hypothetical protein